MKIRIEISSLASKNISGVANYTRLLAEALNNEHAIYGSYFNFLNRQVEPTIDIKKKEKNIFIPLKIYAKLQSFNLAPPFDFFKKNVDLTIFPNFATWPSIKSTIKATVIHDLNNLYFPDCVEVKNLAHLKRVVPRSIKKADFIITVSEAVKSELIKEFSINPEKCVVTNIPPDVSFCKKNNNEIHNKYKIPTKKFIYFIGNLEPRKDLPTLIQAYRKLPTEIKKEYSLVLAGGNGWKTEASRRELDDAKNANENIVHIGYIDQKDSSALYQKASLFVMPSIYEGFGMPILEALACETPVLASDIPVLRESGGDAIYYAEKGDSDSFKDKIIEILSNNNTTDFKQKAKIHLSKFSWDKNVEAITNKVKKIKLVI